MRLTEAERDAAYAWARRERDRKAKADAPGIDPADGTEEIAFHA
jgi:hypothetical protein